MSFSSSHSVVIAASPADTYDQLSGIDNFLTLLKLAPTCHSVEVQQTEDVCIRWSADHSNVSSQPLLEIVQNRPSIEPVTADNASSAPTESQGTFLGTRIYLRGIERIPMGLGLTRDIEILGAQTFVPSLKMHIYDTDAAAGTVKTYKLRRFVEDESQEGQAGTLIEEYIAGETSWLLRRFTESACRDAHVKHMSMYPTMVK